jgi:hypothetical protein
MSRPSDLRSAAELAATKPHGTRMKYLGGCRCRPCRAANSRYSCWREAERREGRGAGLVDAKKARRHILKLAERGIGYKSVAKDARVAKMIVFEIRNGTRTRIRESTERRILFVGESAARSATVIDARPTWKKIAWLLSEGFTKRSLAERLGYTNGALQFDQDTILARNARKVDRLYRTLRVG